MNKVLILLLVISVQSQSDGTLVPNPNTDHHFQDSQLEGWDGGKFPYAEDLSEIYKKRSLTNDAFTRRSALDKNFMRFGRGSEAPREHRLHLPFYRFVRGLKDNFIRFGRGEKSGFIRFGRTRPEDFFRAGKSLRENFIRFGKADKNFMRLGRGGSNANHQESLSLGEAFQKSDRSAGIQDNFLRFGKGNMNGTNLPSFGKGGLNEDGSNEKERDSASEKDVRRKRRRTQEEYPAGPTLTDFSDRSFAFFNFPPGNFPERISSALDGSWQNFQKIKTSRLIPFFPVFPNILKHTHSFEAATKRDRASSNFIRFG